MRLKDQTVLVTGSTGGIGRAIADRCVAEGASVVIHGLDEAASTRVLIYAGRLIREEVPPRRACQVAVTWGITDDEQIQRSIDEVVSSIFA